MLCIRARGNLPLPEPASPGHQPSEEHIDGLTARPFWDVSSDPTSFPWASKLEANANIIAEEFQQQLLQREENAEKSALFSGDSAWQSKVMGTGWSAFRLQRLGVWSTENCAKFPNTYNLLKELNIPLAVRGVCFARQTPGSGVGAHTDGRNFILTSHLGLKIPEGTWDKSGTIKFCTHIANHERKLNYILEYSKDAGSK
jgi:aspartyl/asparaginyl beta-hydroxylase (cupin superfamily)